MDLNFKPYRTRTKMTAAAHTMRPKFAPKVGVKSPVAPMAKQYAARARRKAA